MNWMPAPITFIALLSVVLVATTGCLEPDRTEYRDSAAEEVCDEAEDCENLDGMFGESYSSHADCIIGERERFNNYWPENECSDDRIDPDEFDSCLDRARIAACDANIFDLGSAYSECQASNVCTN